MLTRKRTRLGPEVDSKVPPAGARDATHTVLCRRRAPPRSLIGETPGTLPLCVCADVCLSRLGCCRRSLGRVCSSWAAKMQIKDRRRGFYLLSIDAGCRVLGSIGSSNAAVLLSSASNSPASDAPRQASSKSSQLASSPPRFSWGGRLADLTAQPKIDGLAGGGASTASFFPHLDPMGTSGAYVAPAPKFWTQRGWTRIDGPGVRWER